MNLENTVKKASQILKNHHIYSHELDAQIILSDIMGIKREFLITNSETNISKKVLDKYNIAIRKPTSPTRVIRKAFLDAAAAEGRVVQNPINK